MHSESIGQPQRRGVSFKTIYNDRLDNSVYWWGPPPKYKYSAKYKYSEMKEYRIVCMGVLGGPPPMSDGLPTRSASYTLHDTIFHDHVDDDVD